MLRILSIIILCFSPGLLNGQTSFNEGSIVYKVTITAPSGIQSTSGIYSVFLKGRTVRKDLVMDNGYRNSTLINENTNTVYSLKEVSKDRYAVQLDYPAYLARDSKFAGLQIINEGTADFKKIKAKKGKVKFKDGTASSIVYSDEWVFNESNLFERLPGINVLPVSFEYTTDEGMTMHFDLENIKAEPMESSLFVIPAGYKIISNEEYKNLSR
jgi:hypothetical protein